MPFTWLEIESLQQKRGVIQKNLQECRKLQQELSSIELSRRKSMDNLQVDYLTYQKKLKMINDRIASNKSKRAARYVVKDDGQRRDELLVKSAEEIANRDRDNLQAENCVPRLDYMGSSKSEPPKDNGHLAGEPRLLRRGRASTFDSHDITNKDQNSSTNELQDVPYRNKSHSFTELSQNIKSKRDDSPIGKDGKPISMHSKGEGRKRNGTPHPKKWEELFLFDQQQTKNDYESGDFARISQRRFTIADHVTPVCFVSGLCSQPRGRSAEETQKTCCSDLRATSQSMLQSTSHKSLKSSKPFHDLEISLPKSQKSKDLRKFWKSQ